MKNLIKLEEAGMFILAIYFSYQLPFAGWLFWALLLAPDIGMIGYLINTKTGSITYNLFHHKGIAIAVWIVGMYLQNDALTFSGILLFGHSSMDRMFAYGLKMPDNFKHTHLGWLQ